MCGGIRWCLFTLLLFYRSSLVAAQRSNCEEFDHEVTFDPHLSLGNWTIVYYRPGLPRRVVELTSITELTPAQLVQYQQVVKDYPASALKLNVGSTTGSSKRSEGVIIIPTDTFGNLDAWYLEPRRNGQFVTTPWVRRLFKWKTVEGFLLIMSCQPEMVVIASRSSVPDEVKLQRVLEDLPHD